LDPNRCTSDAAVTLASLATSASVSFAGPSFAMARKAAMRISWSVFWRGRGLIAGDYKRPFTLCLISKQAFTYSHDGAGPARRPRTHQREADMATGAARQVHYGVAASLDGYIAGPKGEAD